MKTATQTTSGERYVPGPSEFAHPDYDGLTHLVSNKTRQCEGFAVFHAMRTLRRRLSELAERDRAPLENLLRRSPDEAISTHVEGEISSFFENRDGGLDVNVRAIQADSRLPLAV